MRRLVALFLLVLLPLECSWAAVASYCAHEGRAQHFGHHVAEHGQAQAAPAGVDDGATSVGPDAAAALDVDGCHGHGHCTGLISVPEAVTCGGSATGPHAPFAASDSASPPARPERPQWARLA